MPDTHIRISEEMWKELNRQKNPGDTFDDVIRRMVGENHG
jgi:predicted CopG family antitoxin